MGGGVGGGGRALRSGVLHASAEHLTQALTLTLTLILTLTPTPTPTPNPNPVPNPYPTPTSNPNQVCCTPPRSIYPLP